MEDEEKSLQSLRAQQLSTLNLLVELVMSPLLFHQRQSVEALLTIKVHERDILQTLIEDSINDTENFQWKRYILHKYELT